MFAELVLVHVWTSLPEPLVQFLPLLLDPVSPQVLLRVGQVVPELSSMSLTGSLDQCSMPQSIWVLNIPHILI